MSEIHHQREMELLEAQLRECRDENTKLRSALKMFACDCIETGDLCPAPQNCRNYLARAALGGEND
jgi:hypothetical protein